MLLRLSKNMSVSQERKMEDPVQCTTRTTATIDEILVLVGEYGMFQKIVNLMFCINMFPSIVTLLIMSFCTESPPWRCASNSSMCSTYNKTYESKDTFRCSIPRGDWEYVTSRDYSIVTEFDLICDKEYLTVFPTSVLFFGFMFGASVLGWFADNFGRKRVHFFSLSIVISLGFVSTFVGNFYAFLVCRFVIGFFLHGSFPQVYVMISEIVGNKDRPWANNVTFVAGAFSLLLLPLQAYLLSNWKLLIRVCTMPYIFVLLFAFFIPESVRYLRVKGDIKGAMLVFQRIAHWNKRILPPNITLAPATTSSHQKTSPFDLFRTRRILLISFVISFSSLTGSSTYYSLMLGARNLTGHMYTDFAVLTSFDIPMAFIGTYLVNRFGRKRNTMFFLLVASACCLALAFTPKQDKMKIARMVIGMVGKTSLVTSGMSRNLWAIELFPTHIRGEGFGLAQVFSKIGATSSSWIVTELTNFYDGAPFLLIGILSFCSFCLQSRLPETKGAKIADVEEESPGSTSSEHGSKCEDVNIRSVESGGQQVASYTNNAMQLNEINVSNNEDDI